MTVRSLSLFPIHLGCEGSAVPQPQFGGMEWYAGYEERYKADGPGGRLVSMHSFNESWTSWEMHPAGEEVVICVAGRIRLIQQLADGTEQQFGLGCGQYAINGPCIWHTADVEAPATALFITAGEGTQHRPR